jgi:ketosteroid isomerase-like protein
MTPLEIVQRGYEFYQARDFAAVFGLLSPDIEIDQTDALPWGGRHRGLDAAKGFFQTTARYTEATPILERYISAGNDVVPIGNLVGCTRQRRIAFSIAIVHVWTVEDSSVTRFQAFIDTPAMMSLLARDGEDAAAEECNNLADGQA